jgi:hypothetical protein
MYQIKIRAAQVLTLSFIRNQSVAATATHHNTRINHINGVVTTRYIPLISCIKHDLIAIITAVTSVPVASSPVPSHIPAAAAAADCPTPTADTDCVAPTATSCPDAQYQCGGFRTQQLFSIFRSAEPAVFHFF